MANQTRTITLTVEDNFSRQLRQLAQLLDDSGDSLDNLQSAAGDSRGFSTLIRNADHLTTALRNVWSIGSGVINTLNGMATEGIAIAQTSEAFDRLAGSSQEADKWIRAMQDASRGSLTEFEATNQAIQLITMGLVDSADEAGRFMEIAAITKAINPELGTMENTITNIGMTLANDSWMRLDQLGVDAARAKARIEELKGEGIAMTEAFDIAVMEQLEENAAKIGTDVLDIGEDTAAMQASFRQAKENAQEFAVVVFEKLAPSLNDAATAGGQILETLTNLASGEWSIDIVLNAIGEEIVSPGSDLYLAFEDLYNALGLTDTNRQVSGLTTAYLDQGMATTPEEFQVGMANAFRDALPSWFTSGGGTGAMISTLPIMSYAPDVPMSMLGTGTYSPAGALRPAAPGLSIADQLRSPLIGAGLLYGRPYGTGIAADELRGFDPESLFSIPEFAASAALFSGGGGMGFGTRDMLGQAQTMTGGLLDTMGVQQTMENMQDIAASSAEFQKNMREAADLEFDSLAEKFGLTPSGLHVDVLREMNSALADAGVEAETAAEAMDAFRLMTGQATGGSELFEGQMARLAGELEAGRLSAEGYAQQVAQLSQMDLSTIDAVVGGYVQGGMFDEANAYIDNLAAMDLEQLQGVFDLMTPKEGDTEVSPFRTLMDGAVEMQDVVTSSSEAAREAAVKEFDEISTQGIEAFGGLKESSIEDMGEMLDYINSNFSGTQWTFTATVLSGSEVAQMGTTTQELIPANLPEFAEGGFTGSGSRPFPALLHPNEVVIPLNRMTAGGGGNGGSMQVDLYIDGRQVESAVSNAKRLKNEAY